MKTTLVSPTGAREVELNSPFWWSLLLGPFYFAYHRMWLHTLISAVFAVFTSGISVLIYPFFAEKLIMDHYSAMGWTVKGTGPVIPEKVQEIIGYEEAGTMNILDAPEYKK